MHPWKTGGTSKRVEGPAFKTMLLTTSKPGEVTANREGTNSRNRFDLPVKVDKSQQP
jgi:hypothetical protein